MNNIVIIGASGGIGQAVLQWCCRRWPEANIWATCRTGQGSVAVNSSAVRWMPLDLESDDSIDGFAAALAGATDSVDLLVVCSGWLHDEHHMPEKSLSDLTPTAFTKALRINAIAVLLLVARLESLLVRAPGSVDARSRIVCLSAKVGSISDNNMGGWHAYRMSKAALNMGVRNLGIEFARNKRKPIAVAVHPGTTHSELSAPFAKSRLPVVDAETTAERLGNFIENMNEDQQGKLFHWDGTALPF